MAEPPAKRLDQKMEPDIAELERGEESDKNGQNAPRLDIEAVRVELVSGSLLLQSDDAAELSSRSL